LSVPYFFRVRADLLSVMVYQISTKLRLIRTPWKQNMNFSLSKSMLYYVTRVYEEYLVELRVKQN
jgi:hypothetical protein